MYKQKEKKKEYIGIRVDKTLKDAYQKYCDNNGYSISKRIRLFIESELNHIKNEN